MMANLFALAMAERAKQKTKEIIDFDINQAVAKTSAVLNIPTYVPDNDEAVHPSVVYVPEGWNGYKYWMAFTPYTASNNQYENPSIVVSNDGVNWIVPPGLTNPLEPAPPGGYNSDVHLILSPDGKTLYLYYREYVNPYERIMFKSSTNGINWTPKKVVLETLDSVERNLAPAVVWDEATKQYIMWTVDMVPSPKVFRRRTSPTPDGTFGNSVACTFPLPAKVQAAGDDIWHVDVHKVGDKFYALMNTGGGSGGVLFLSKSSDGITWTTQTDPFMERLPANGRKLYRSCFVPKITGSGNKFAVWYSSAPDFGAGWEIGYFEISFDKDVADRAKKVEVLSAVNKIYPYVLADTFDRADTTSGLGTATTGQTWTVSAGTFGILNGEAYATSAVNTRAVIDTGYSDGEVSVSVTVTGGQEWLIFRFQDSNNYFRFGTSGGILQLQKVESGSAQQISTFAAKLPIGGDLSVKFVGNQISLYLNGNLLETVTSTLFQTATKIGLQTQNTTTRFDNLLFKKN